MMRYAHESGTVAEPLGHRLRQFECAKFGRVFILDYAKRPETREIKFRRYYYKIRKISYFITIREIFIKSHCYSKYRNQVFMFHPLHQVIKGA